MTTPPAAADNVDAPPPAPPTTLVVGDVTLLAWRPADADRALTAVRGSLPALAAFMPWASDDYDLAASAEFLRRSAAEWLAGTAFAYALVATADPGGPILGSAGLHRRIGAGALDIGYWVHSAHTRRGLATRAAALLTRAAFELPAVSTVEIHHDVANVASGGVPHRLGYTRFATVDKPAEAPEETGRQHHWRMAREDYVAGPVPGLLGSEKVRENLLTP